jgi:hypothetical protein
LNAVKDIFTLKYISIIDQHCFRSSAVFLKLNNAPEISTRLPPCWSIIFDKKNNMIIIKGKTGATPIGMEIRGARPEVGQKFQYGL